MCAGEMNAKEAKDERTQTERVLSSSCFSFFVLLLFRTYFRVELYWYAWVSDVSDHFELIINISDPLRSNSAL